MPKASKRSKKSKNHNNRKNSVKRNNTQNSFNTNNKFKKIKLFETTDSSYPDKYSIVNYNEIFPLKKYKFYDFWVYGPNKLDFLSKYYGKDIWTMGKRDHDNGDKFSINGFNYPANINLSSSGCSQTKPRCIFWNKPNYFTPSCCARNLTNLLYHLKTVFEKNNIKYFIYYGTLIGSVRHGGIIPWDTDIDVHIFESDFPKLISLKNELEKTGHHLVKASDRLYRLNCSKLNELHIDIFSAICF